MMFRSLFFVAPVLALDQQYKELLQRASSELSSGTLRSLEENLAMKGGCEKYMAEKVEGKHKYEEDALVAEWKKKFNYKRKVKKDVKISEYCVEKVINANPPVTDDTFKDTKCKTAEKAKKQCSKSLKATCNFVRSTTRKLLKKAQKGSRKVRKEEGFTSLRDPLKTKVNDYSCKDVKKVKPEALTAKQFTDIEAHWNDVYPEIVTLKDTTEALLTAKEEAKKKHKADLKAAKDAKSKCEKDAETAEKTAIDDAKKTYDTEKAAADAKTDKTEKEQAHKDAKKKRDDAIKKAKDDEEKADEACDVTYDAAKKTAAEELKNFAKTN